MTKTAAIALTIITALLAIVITVTVTRAVSHVDHHVSDCRTSSTDCGYADNGHNGDM